MVKRWYESKNGGTLLQLWSDTISPDFEQSALQTELALIIEKQAASDAIRVALAQCDGFGDLPTYDAHLDSEFDRLSDTLDYFKYANRTETLNIKDGAWFDFEAVESVCGDEPGNEAVNILDAASGTFWQHNVNHPHEMVLRLRGYLKKVTKVRFRVNASENIRGQIQDVNIRASQGLGQIDEPVNLQVARLNLLDGQPTNWTEVLFPGAKRCRYVKLDGFGSLHSGNEARIRDFQAWVITHEY